MLVRTLTWAQTVALNPNTPLCTSCGSDLPPVLAGCGGRRCRECRLASNVVVLPIRPRNLKHAA